MRIGMETRGRVLVVRCQGELDVASADRLRGEIDRALADERLDRLCLNLEGVSFIDSSGLGAILGRYRRIQQRSGRMVIVGAASVVRSILELSGVLRIIPAYDSEPQALARL